jgi:hypothetical protein
MGYGYTSHSLLLIIAPLRIVDHGDALGADDASETALRASPQATILVSFRHVSTNLKHESRQVGRIFIPQRCSESERLKHAYSD